MDKKKLAILITIIVLVILFVGTYIIYHQGKNKPTTSGNETKETASGILDDFSKNDSSALTEDANELLRLLQLNTINSCSPTTVSGIYYKKNYTVNTMPDGLKIYLGIMQYKDSRNFATSSTIILTKEEVRKGVEKVFGPDVKYKDTSYGTKACIGAYDAFSYDAATGNYTIKPEKCNCDASKTGEIFMKPISTKETDTSIVVTEKILIAVPTYDEERKKVIFKIFNTFDFKKEPLGSEETYRFSDYEEKLSSYQFTFKKHKNGNYYFNSVNVVK